MKIGSDNLESKFLNSTFYLDDNEVVSNRKIALEFKNVFSPEKQLKPELNSSGTKEAEIYENYTGTDYWSCQFQPIGTGTYTVVGKGVELFQPNMTESNSYIQNKIEQNYNLKKLKPVGTFVNKLC